MAPTSHLDDPFQIPSTVPSIVHTDAINTTTPSSSQSTSGTSTDTDENPNKSKLSRPQLTSRKSSGTNIIPREAPTEAPPQDFPPDDARAMSPRRSTEETDKMLTSARQSIERRVIHLKRRPTCSSSSLNNSLPCHAHPTPFFAPHPY